MPGLFNMHILLNSLKIVLLPLTLVLAAAVFAHNLNRRGSADAVSTGLNHFEAGLVITDAAGSFDLCQISDSFAHKRYMARFCAAGTETG